MNAPHAFQTDAELELLADLYRKVRPGRVLEIGVAHGGTLYRWLTDGTPQLVVAVDTFTFADPRPVFPEWRKASCELVVVEGDSQHASVSDRVGGYGPFDWVLIDGDHRYQAVKHDWETYGAMVAPGGVVVLHDIHYTDGPGGSEVHRLWAEIVASGWRTQEIVVEATPTLGFGLVWK